MKFVQAGILIALVVVGVLLFRVYRGQQQQQPAVAPVAQEAQPAASAPAAPVEPPSATPPGKIAESRPSPVKAKPANVAAAAADAARQEAASPVQAPPAQTASSSSATATSPAYDAPTEKVSPAPPAAPPAPPAPRVVTVPAGTLLSARLSETLSSDKVKEGDTFTGVLDKPLVVDGLVLAERGARVEGRIVESTEAGRVRGTASLSVQLVRMLASDGQKVDIRTDAFHKEGETTRKEDAAKVGGGAGIGAIIGAIAGGGKGAAIGAAVGGAAGAGTVAATRGKPAVLPVETRIDFRLSHPVTLTERK